MKKKVTPNERYIENLAFYRMPFRVEPGPVVHAAPYEKYKGDELKPFDGRPGAMEGHDRTKYPSVGQRC